MPAKKDIDLKKIEELAAKHSLSQIGVEMGYSTGWASYQSAKYPDFLAAVNRGRQAGGMEPFVPKSAGGSGLRQKAAGNGTGFDREQLDLNSRKVLAELEDYDGIALGELEIALRPLPESDVERSLTVLVRNGLAKKKGAKFFALKNSSRQRKGQRPARKAPQVSDAEIDLSRDRASTTAAGSLNGHAAAGVVTVMEKARVELLYQRVHGEASLHAPEIIESLGNVIESLGNGLECVVKQLSVLDAVEAAPKTKAAGA
jgi:hypothetical protein